MKARSNGSKLSSPGVQKSRVQNGSKSTFPVEETPSVELRAREGCHRFAMALCLIMTGQIALIMKTQVARSAFERVVRLKLLSEMLGSLLMIPQPLLRAKRYIARLTVECLGCHRLLYAICLMLSVSSWIVGSRSGYSLACFADVFIIVDLHLLVVVALSILGFHRKTLLLLLIIEGVDLLSRKGQSRRGLPRSSSNENSIRRTRGLYGPRDRCGPCYNLARVLSLPRTCKRM